MNMSLLHVSVGQTVELVPDIVIGKDAGSQQEAKRWTVTGKDDSGITLTLSGGIGTDITVTIPADSISEGVRGDAVEWTRIMLHQQVHHANGKTTFEPGYRKTGS